MSKWAITLIIVWLIIVIFPEIIAFALWGILIVLWAGLLMTKYKMWSEKTQNDYFKFWDYKIYKNNKK